MVMIIMMIMLSTMLMIMMVMPRNRKYNSVMMYAHKNMSNNDDTYDAHRRYDTRQHIHIHIICNIQFKM